MTAERLYGIGGHWSGSVGGSAEIAVCETSAVLVNGEFMLVVDDEAESTVPLVPFAVADGFGRVFGAV